MARSQKDDPRFGELQHHAWNYRGDSAEICGPAGVGQPPLIPNQTVMSDGMFTNTNMFAANEVYLKHMHNNMNVPVDSGPVPDEGLNPRPQSHQGLQNNAVLNLGNGQMVNVYYDKNNQRLMIPVSGQYELFSQPQGLREVPQPPHSHMFTLNQDFTNDNNNVHVAEPTAESTCYNKEQSNMPTSNFLKEVLGNWEPNSTGTYSPFGQNFPLNHPDAPAMNMIHPQVVEPQIPMNIGKPDTNSPKRSDPLADTGNKKRIVAEVKPMRPTYSDVLAKNTKNNVQPEVTRKSKVSSNIEAKSANKINNSKADKPATNTKPASDEGKQKGDNKKLNMTSSGSESGDINTDDTEKCQKPSKKRNKKSNMSRKWSSVHDVTQEEEDSFTATNDSQFIFIETQPEKPTKKNKKSHNNTKNADKSAVVEDLQPNDDDDENEFHQFVFEEGQVEGLKARKKKESRSYSHKLSKQSQEKKKANVCKWRRNKPGYLGVAQTYLENWCAATYKALVWFLYLLSDICRMSAHLSFDLCTSAFTQTYVSSQAVWRSGRQWARRLGDNRCLLWIDGKLGHTRIGFWRRLKCFKKETEPENGNEATKLNANIPLPATGEEAMKRLLACKGKDPYSILGVSVSCTDEEIKRYYRRQAFLVHPDKNQQPGAEEAFKILQHAFDHIGEPERRSAYDRAAVESRHVEAAWSELSQLLAQLHDKMEFAHNTIRCTNCGRRHKRVLTDRPCYAARYCSSCRIRHSAKEGDIWAESSMMGLLVMYYACMDGAVYQITQWASCQKKNLKQLRPDCHVVQYRIVLGSKAAAADLNQRPSACGHDPNLEEFLNNLYTKSGGPASAPAKPPSADATDKKRRNKKTKP